MLFYFKQLFYIELTLNYHELAMNYQKLFLLDGFFLRQPICGSQRHLREKKTVQFPRLRIQNLGCF